MRTHKLVNQQNNPSVLRKKVSYNKTWSSNESLAFPSISNHLVRNLCVEWLYKVDRRLYIARSTLFLAIGLLDRIMLKHFDVNQNNFEVIAGALLLLSTKFNEVYPIQARKLSSEAKFAHSLDEYEKAEAQILETLDFTITTENNIYEEIAAFQAKFEGEQSENVQEAVKMAFLHPTIAFKYGLQPLLNALQGLASVGLNQLKNGVNQTKEVTELRNELHQLKGDSRRKLLTVRA